MKVVHISRTITGGAGIAALRIHEGLVKLNNETESYFVQKFPLNNNKYNIYQCTPFHNLYFRIVNKLGLKSYLTKEGYYKNILTKYPQNYEIATIPFSYCPLEKYPLVKEADIIHLHWISDFINYPTFFKNIKQPIVWTLHDQNPFLGLFHYEGDEVRNEKILGHINKKIFSTKIKNIIKKDNIHIVCPSNWMKEKSQASKILGGFPHYLIPYGFNPNNYPLLNKFECKNYLNLNNGRINILFIAFGINVYRKGLDILLNAIKDLDTSKFNLISVGGGEELSIDKKINYIRISRTDDISELNRIYAAADITIIPSREDNSPNVMTESLLNGTPVISFSNGGMAEYITTGKNGILVDKIDSESLRNAINKILSDKYKFKEEDIREDILRKMSIDLQTQKYVDLYHQILNNK